MAPEASLWAGTVLVLAGVALGAALTLYGAVRAEWRLPRGLAFVLDTLFVLAAAVPVAAGLAVGTWGAVRLWAVAGLVLGLLLWSTLAAPAIGTLCRAAARQLRRSWRSALRPLRGALSRLAGFRLRWRRPKTPPCD